MGAPIVVQPRQNPWQGMLMQMYMTKFAHNLKVKQDTLDLEKTKVILEEKRNYQEKTQLAKEGRTETRTKDTENRKAVQDKIDKGWIPEEQITDPNRKKNGMFKMVGGKALYYPNTPNETETHYPVWEKDQWKMEKKGNLKAYVHPKDPNSKVVYKRPSEKPPPGYLPYSSPLVTINAKPSIGEKQKQKDFAYLNSPKFISDVAKDVAQLNKFDWEMWEPNERDAAVKKEADKRMRISFPNSVYGVQNGKTGWYVKEGDEYKLVAPWSR